MRTYKIHEPTCNRDGCFGCENGKCMVLNNNNFGDRECPFYKDKELTENIKED